MPSPTRMPGDHQHVEFHGFPAFHAGGLSLKLCHRVPQHEPEAVFRQVLFQDGGAVRVQIGAHGVRCKVADSDAPGPVPEALGALQADEARADDEHPALLADGLFQGQGILQRGEEEAVFHCLQPLEAGGEGVGTQAEAEGVVAEGLPRGEDHPLRFRLQLLRRHAVAHLHPVLFIEIFPPPAHARDIRLPLQVVGDEGSAVVGEGLGGDEGDLPLPVPAADTLRAADAGDAAADDEIFFHA